MGSSDGTEGRFIEIAEGIKVQVNLSGSEIFGQYYTDTGLDTIVESGLIATLTKLCKELNSANPDKEAIRQGLAALDDDLNTLLSAQSTLGGILSRLEIAEHIHKENQINIIETKSGVQDVDMAKAISDLTYQQTALQASLQVSAGVIQPSLLNYL
jgi:flagellar hook-associated protein 3 FlgL